MTCHISWDSTTVSALTHLLFLSCISVCIYRRIILFFGGSFSIIQVRFMGSALVVIGLYGVLWGKDREMNENQDQEDNQKKVKQQHTVKSDFKDDIESRLPVGEEGGASTSGCGNGATRLVSP
ncbi:unnamed protein product [Brassica rapa subsp. trilocularis]